MFYNIKYNRALRLSSYTRVSHSTSMDHRVFSKRSNKSVYNKFVFQFHLNILDKLTFLNLTFSSKSWMIVAHNANFIPIKVL